MSEKKAFVFDTNFIVQNRELNEVIDNLKDSYSVYVSQVSIDERIAQQCRELKADYSSAELCKEKYKRFAEVRIKRSYEDMAEYYREGIQENYVNAFGDKIIPLVKDDSMLSAVLNRAYNKVPPFISESNASDKGFKDALIWESILAFFKDSGEKEVLLITDDGGFIKNAVDLCAEFSKVTGKTLSIHPNSYYRELLKPELVEEPKKPPQIINVELLRERIQSALKSICYIQLEDSWGNEIYEETFVLKKQVDSAYIQAVLDNIEKKRLDYLFETEISASAILELDDRITDTEFTIPMRTVDDIVKLYQEIKTQYPDYTEQFVSAVVRAVNGNYHEQHSLNQGPKLNYTEDELPF